MQLAYRDAVQSVHVCEMGGGGGRVTLAVDVCGKDSCFLEPVTIPVGPARRSQRNNSHWGTQLWHNVDPGSREEGRSLITVDCLHGHELTS
jgi:hypothetical protein